MDKISNEIDHKFVNFTNLNPLNFEEVKNL